LRHSVETGRLTTKKLPHRLQDTHIHKYCHTNKKCHTRKLLLGLSLLPLIIDFFDTLKTMNNLSSAARFIRHLHVQQPPAVAMQ